MVGLFIPGNILQMASSFLFGAFNKMYLLLLALLKALILNNSLFSRSVFSLLSFINVYEPFFFLLILNVIYVPDGIVPYSIPTFVGFFEGFGQESGYDYYYH